MGHKEITVTHLRKLMLDELQRRNYAQNTVRAYIHAVEDFARYFRRSPDRLGPNHIREYQVHLFRDCKLSAGTIEGRTAALRFLFVKTLRRPYLPDHIPVSEASEANAYSTKSGRGEAAHCFRSEPDAPYHADDAVRNRSTPGSWKSEQFCTVWEEQMSDYGGDAAVQGSGHCRLGAVLKVL